MNLQMRISFTIHHMIGLLVGMRVLSRTRIVFALILSLNPRKRGTKPVDSWAVKS